MEPILEKEGFDKYEKLSTGELEQLLRADAEDNGLDESTRFAVMKLLAERTEVPSPRSAWEDFLENYLPDKSPAMCKTRKPAMCWRQIAAMAAIVVLMFTIPAASNAFEGGSVLGYQAVWDEDFFWFEWARGKTPDQQAQHLAGLSLEELRRRGYCPSWIPGGFVYGNRKNRDSDGRESVLLSCFDGDRVLYMNVNEVSEGNSHSWCANGESVQPYRCHGQTYYIFRNMERYTVCWIKDGLECGFSGDISVYEVKKMIHSMEG